jgi:hypothetical protein
MPWAQEVSSSNLDAPTNPFKNLRVSRIGIVADGDHRYSALEDGTASLKLALQVGGYFELGEDEARQIAAQVGQAVATWRREAEKLGLTPAKIDRMASAFEHFDLEEASGFAGRLRHASSGKAVPA